MNKSCFNYILAILFLIFTDVLQAAEGGGVTTIGDGGFAVICDHDILAKRGRKTFHFLDLYESALEGKRRVNTLGPAHLRLSTKVRIGLDRIERKFQLSTEESKRLHYVSKILLQEQFDPWVNIVSSSQFAKILNTLDVRISEKTFKSLNYNRCYIEVAIIRYSEEKMSIPHVQRLCQLSPGGPDLCFLTNKSVYSKLGNGDRACLILHEVMRYLPLDKRPQTDRQLRLWTADICTA